MLAFATADLERYADLDFDDEVFVQISPTHPERLASADIARPKSMKDAVDARLPNVLFALVAGSIESTWTDQSWRDTDSRSLSYLGFLGQCGYELSAIEHAMTAAESTDLPRSAATSTGR